MKEKTKDRLLLIAEWSLIIGLIAGAVILGWGFGWYIPKLLK